MRLLIILLFLLFPISIRAQTLFFETLYDVPIMEGLTEIPDMAMTFDKPNGRISQAGAVMEDVSQARVQDFYDKVLVQLGWKPAGENTYIREGEQLLISYDAGKTVKFLLKPL
jgi:hypothetical protein